MELHLCCTYHDHYVAVCIQVAFHDEYFTFDLQIS